MASDSDKGGKRPKAAGPTPTGDLKRGLRTNPSQPPPPGTVDLKRGGHGRRLQMIDYPDDEPLIDHKGRSKPLYKPQTQRPQDAAWRPSRPVKLLLGLFPGLRLLALVNVKEGLVYLLLGILSLIGGVMLASRWASNIDRVQHLQLRRELLLGHAAMIAAIVLVFELLRLAGTLAEPNRGPRLPRVVATLLIPSAFVLWGSVELIGLWPRLVEPVFFTALLLTAGSVPGALWCLFDGGSRDEDQQRLLRRISGGLVALALGAGVAVVLSGAEPLAEAAQHRGFALLPQLLR